MRIAGDFSPLTAEEPNVRSFYNEFREFMRQLRPVPVSHKTAIKPFLHQSLDTRTHVWLQEKPIRPALKWPYTGPHKVISRNNEGHTFNMDVNGRTRTVNIERLKPAFILQEDSDGAKDNAPEPIRTPTPTTDNENNLQRPTGILKPSQLPTPVTLPTPLTPPANGHTTQPVRSTQLPSPKPKRLKFVPNILKRKRKN